MSEQEQVVNPEEQAQPNPVMVALSHLVRLGAGIQKLLNESLMTQRLSLQMQAKNTPLIVDLSGFQKVGKVVMHPFAWGLIITDETSAPTEEQYRNSVEQWAETLGISVEFTGEFVVTCHDDAIAKLKAQMKRRSTDGEVQPHAAPAAGGADRGSEESGPAGS